MKYLAIPILLIAHPGDLLAGQALVFRDALEGWSADHFRLIATSDGPLNGTLQEKLIDLLVLVTVILVAFIADSALAQFRKSTQST